MTGDSEGEGWWHECVGWRWIHESDTKLSTNSLTLAGWKSPSFPSANMPCMHFWKKQRWRCACQHSSQISRANYPQSQHRTGTAELDEVPRSREYDTSMCNVHKGRHCLRVVSLYLAHDMWSAEEASNLWWNDGKGGKGRELGMHFIEVLQVSLVRSTDGSTHWGQERERRDGGREGGGRKERKERVEVREGRDGVETESIEC